MTEEHTEAILAAQRKVLMSIRATMRELIELNRLTSDIPNTDNVCFHLVDYAEQLEDQIISGKFTA